MAFQSCDESCTQPSEKNGSFFLYNTHPTSTKFPLLGGWLVLQNHFKLHRLNAAVLLMELCDIQVKL